MSLVVLLLTGVYYILVGLFKLLALVAKAVAGRGSARPTARATVAPSSASGPGRQSTPSRWLGPCDRLTVAGITINDPLVYSCDLPTPTDPSDVNVRLPVSSGAPFKLDYWPSYSHIPASARHAYLTWLASGKRELPSDEGFLFLYYYGLERRALVDGEDRELVFREVLRLRRLDAARPKRTSFRGYSASLLALLVAQGIDEKLADEWLTTTVTLDENCAVRTDENCAAVALHLLHSRGVPVPGSVALAVAPFSPLARQSTVIRRVAREFRELFLRRYRETLGDGLHLDAATGVTTFRYHAASSSLAHQSFGVQVQDVVDGWRPFVPIARIWNGCIEDLRALSRASATAGEVVSKAQWEALPPELRSGVEHPLTGRLYDLLKGSGNGMRFSLVSVGAAAELCELPARPKLTASQSRSLAETLHHCGYAIEPDATLTGTAYSWTDHIAVIAGAAPLDGATKKYVTASRFFRVGLAVASADGRISDEEESMLRSQIDVLFHLDDSERRRLEALWAVLLNQGTERVAISKAAVERMTATERQSVGKLLVAIAAADGVVTRSELRILRQAYRQLGLGADLLEQTIGELLPAQTSAPITVQSPTSTRTGEAIPAPPDERLELDREKLQAAFIDTREVARLLADAMEVEEASEPPAPASVSTATAERVGTSAAATEPPARFRAFLADLRTRPRWTRAEAEGLAREHGHMLDGALEELNEWSFDTCGSALIEEADDVITVQNRTEGRATS